MKFPPITAEKFGLVQERLWNEPYKLLIAVMFLNKTKGQHAMPIFRQMMERYPLPQDLAQAEMADVCEMIYHLGLQTQRAKKFIKFATAWIAEPPEAGRRHRTLHYPNIGDGKEVKPGEVLDDAADCAGALEIGHLPGCGPYAWDSWRIVCRDVLRGVATGYNGEGARPDFEPEWKRVVPLDKELRAFLRWMWLREGWIWDPLTGNKVPADEETMRKARV
ncbi:DNA glycosylase, partial [Myriangium duriaei CBS 260.36]